MLSVLAMRGFLEDIGKKALSGEGLKKDEAKRFSEILETEIFDVLPITKKIRERFKGVEINLCGIVNAKSGLCKEDCSFCSQSVKYPTGVKEYPMVEPSVIVESALNAEKIGAREFSIVTSGAKVSGDKDVEKLTQALEGMKDKTNLETCASLGMLDAKTLKSLKDAGLHSYHHNLETSGSFFPSVCTTHEYEEDVDTIRRAKALGLYVCSGGIFGLGESWEDRVELAETLRTLDVDCVPINFLNPRPGTPLEGAKNLTPLECLKIIALIRLMLPTKDIIVCGGREFNLRSLQSLIFAAGANGMMVGNYLTTKGRDPEEDLRMIRDLGLRPRR